MNLFAASTDSTRSHHIHPKFDAKVQRNERDSDLIIPTCIAYIIRPHSAPSPNSMITLLFTSYSFTTGKTNFQAMAKVLVTWRMRTPTVHSPDPQSSEIYHHLRMVVGDKNPHVLIGIRHYLFHLASCCAFIVRRRITPRIRLRDLTASNICCRPWKLYDRCTAFHTKREYNP